MNVMKWTEIVLLSFSLMLGFASFSNADDNSSAGEKVQEKGHDLGKNAKQTWRKTKDEACEMINGKMECAGKKVKHKTQDGIDEVKDKVDAD